MTSLSLLGSLRERFTRVTSSVAFIPQIDGLRALAVLLVIGHHVFASYLETTHRLGTQSLPRDWGMIWSRSTAVAWGMHLVFGVQIFFVISGFVLAIPFARSAFLGKPVPSIKAYFVRRLIRIEPPYLLNMTLLLFSLLLGLGHTWWQAKIMWGVFGGHYLASIAYLHALIYGYPSWVNGIAWTLEIEIQFYLLMPLIGLLFRMRQRVARRGILLGIALAGSLVAQFGVQSERLHLSVVYQLGFFVAGILLADLYLDPPRRLRVGAMAGDGLTLLSAGLIVSVLHWRSELTWTEPFLIMAFFYGVFHGRWASRLFALPVLTIPGTMCYTIYLYHIFLIKQMMPWTSKWMAPVHPLMVDAAAQMALMLVPLMVVSGVLYLLVEKPFIVLSHKATRRWRPVAVTPEVVA